MAAAPNDFLTRLMQARDEETGRGLSDEDLRANLLTFLGAGHETTAVALSWSLYLLSEFPWAADAVRDEARAVLDGGPVTADAIARLSFTRQVFEEAMRLYPPVPIFDRAAAEPDTVAGHDVGKGTMVLVSPYVLHRHETLWEDPDVFDPDRFTPAAVKARHRFQYIPFNVGPRHCIGAAFAMMEGVLALAMMVRDFRIDMVDGHDPQPFAFISLRPKGGLPVTLRPV